MRVSKKEKRRQYRIIYELLYRNGKVYPSIIARKFGSGRKTAAGRLRKFFKGVTYQNTKS
ncbi:MAG: hypothetical protein AYK18_03750 [Theionarchaea archaeon DG-70]|nr:MAG: hypothetical protein AYK18_03750 [Theionarchaea archaeon DG-70]